MTNITENAARVARANRELVKRATTAAKAVKRACGRGLSKHFAACLDQLEAAATESERCADRAASLSKSTVVDPKVAAELASLDQQIAELQQKRLRLSQREHHTNQRVAGMAGRAYQAIPGSLEDEAEQQTQALVKAFLVDGPDRARLMAARQAQALEPCTALLAAALWLPHEAEVLDDAEQTVANHNQRYSRTHFAYKQRSVEDLVDVLRTRREAAAGLAVDFPERFSVHEPRREESGAIL